jgi:hypothetical protein
LSLNKHCEFDNKITFTYTSAAILNKPYSIWNKSNYNYIEIFPAILEGRQWHLSCQMWNRNYISQWVNLYCWEDYEMEIKSALINNNIAHVDQVLVEINLPETGSLSFEKLNIEGLNEQFLVLNFILKNRIQYKKLLKKQNRNQWNIIYLRIFKNLRDRLNLGYNLISLRTNGNILFRLLFNFLIVTSFFSKRLAKILIKTINFILLKYLV